MTKMFTETLGLSADLWLTISLIVVVVAFLVPLLMGLLSGKFKAIKAAMKSAIAKPQTVVAAMKKMPAPIKAQYKTARMGNLKPSMLVTEDVCVSTPYKHSLISKVWLTTLSATLVCAGIGYFSAPLAKEIDELLLASFVTPLTVLIVGGILTVVGGIIGKVAYGGAVKTYAKFMPIMDGDQVQQPMAAQQNQSASPINVVTPQQQAYAEPQQAYAEPQQAYAEPQQVYAEPQQAYAEPQQVYAEPQQAYAEPQQVYAEPQQAYAEPQQAYAEQPPVMTATPQESEEEIRRRAREEAMAQARAQQQAAQAQAQAQPQAAPTGAMTSADEVIAQIEKIDREGASRDAMREVATRLQQERAKPENKTPEQQKRLNDALSKLLKAMSAASRR
ncbi:MAG: hypothetical protein J1G01_01055 [Clostridiales bacterium]|nr:hypothetical protein [Clostridiales bacterium]